jgi:sodium-dependent dicarboxylate transporter 2/3/5
LWDDEEKAVSERGRFPGLYEARAWLSGGELRFERWRRGLGLLLGPLAFAVLLLLPLHDMPREASRLAAVLAWVLIWWITDAVPIPMTALAGTALAVVCGAGTAREMFASFGDPVIFLFLGSFVIAEAMSVHGLGRRIAYAILSRRWVGGSPTRILLAFATATAAVSMWVSSAATTALVFPIAIGVLGALSRLLWRSGQGPTELTHMRFGTGLMLACAYAASIGGLATPVGAAPNLIAIGQLTDLTGTRLEFFDWMVIALPIAAVLLVVVALVLRTAYPPETPRIAGSAKGIAEERAALGAWTRGEKNVLFVFLLTAALWVVPGLAGVISGYDSPLANTLARTLPEGAVALLGAALLFVVPVSWRERRFTITWGEAARIDWGTLFLFGGGLALGEAMFRTGLAESIGGALTRLPGTHSVVLLTFIFSGFAIYLAEVTSATAAATVLVPLAIAAARAAGVGVVEPAIGCAVGCSTAFMLPVATPSNAIVYASGFVPVTKMVKAGFCIDLAAAIIVPAGVLLMCRLLGL